MKKQLIYLTTNPHKVEEANHRNSIMVLIWRL